MKMQIIYCVVLLFLIDCTLFPTIVAQDGQLSVAARISLESDFQKSTFKDVHFPFALGEHKAVSINWGMDLLIEKKIFDDWSIHVGMGYLRNKFNFRRTYDHTLLNIGRDSLPIGTIVYYYTYHLFRFPLGISYTLKETKKFQIELGLENMFNFSFLRIYNGVLPFANANNKYSGFHYFGNSIIFFVRFSKPFSNMSSFNLEPYIRISNTYKKDPILYENEKKINIQTFDAFGLACIYRLGLQKK